MTDCQREIAARVRASLGEAAERELVEGWQRDGVAGEQAEGVSRAELARLLSWRVDASPTRRQIARLRLRRLGYAVQLERLEPLRAPLVGVDAA